MPANSRWDLIRRLRVNLERTDYEVAVTLPEHAVRLLPMCYHRYGYYYPNSRRMLPVQHEVSAGH